MELLIVVVIIGVVYTLVVTKFQKIDAGSVPVSLENLKLYLKSVSKQAGIDDYKKVRFLCLDDCSECDVLIDGDKVSQDNSFSGFLDSSVKVYRYDHSIGSVDVNPKVYFNKEGVEEDVCFSYELNSKGIGDQYIIEYKDKVYDFTTYLEKTPIYASLKELLDAKEKLIQEVIR